MVKIKLEKDKCIGCASCSAICPKRFEMAEDGRSHLIGAEVKEVEELEVEKIECAEAAAESCPSQCIHIEK